MGRTYETIDDQLAAFIEAQPVFFVATSPLSVEGHVNVSPKGLDSLRVIDPRTVAYADLVGSGIETVAHLKENGRIVVMFCAFEGAPRILRLHGRGTVIEPGDPHFDALRPRFPDYPGLRSIISVRCERISDSCGFGVPLYEFRRQRSTLTDWAAKKGEDALTDYQRKWNAESIDGLPGVDPRRRG